MQGERDEAQPEDIKPARNIQFAGFAELLFDKLSELGLIATVDPINFIDHPERALKLQEEMIALIKQIFTQTAYDLARHVVEHAMLTGMSLPGYINKERYIEHTMQTIPDMTAWPNEDNNALIGFKDGKMVESGDSPLD